MGAPSEDQLKEVAKAWAYTASHQKNNTFLRFTTGSKLLEDSSAGKPKVDEG